MERDRVPHGERALEVHHAAIELQLEHVSHAQALGDERMAEDARRRLASARERATRQAARNARRGERS